MVRLKDHSFCSIFENENKNDLFSFFYELKTKFQTNRLGFSQSNINEELNAN